MFVFNSNMLFFVISFFFFFFNTFGLTDNQAWKKMQSWKKIGFLSQGNYETVHHLVPNAMAVIVSNKIELEQQVENGILDAGLISGIPDETKFIVYPSGSISPRGMFTSIRKNNTHNFLRQLIDAAIVRLAMSGKLQEFASKNAPFEFVEVHTCRSADVSKNLPFPSVESFTSNTIRIGALGPYNWHQDGDYTVDPATGFWPDVLNELEKILDNNYTFNRIFYNTSQGVMDALRNGEVDVTEPYWTIDSFYNDRPRSWTFDHGCTLLGYESNFFERRNSTPQESKFNLPLLLSILVLVIVILFIMFLIHRERRGKPVFMKLSTINEVRTSGTSANHAA